MIHKQRSLNMIKLIILIINLVKFLRKI